MNCELMLTYDAPAYMVNVYENQLSRQTGSRNLTGPKPLPTIWHTYMKLVTYCFTPVRPSVRPSFHLSVLPSVHPSICPSFRPSKIFFVAFLLCTFVLFYIRRNFLISGVVMCVCTFLHTPLFSNIRCGYVRLYFFTYTV
jgi:hypothetical protein